MKLQKLTNLTNDLLAESVQVCVEAGMLALRRDSNVIKHEDFMEGISVVSAKKKTTLQYYAQKRVSIQSKHFATKAKV